MTTPDTPQGPDAQIERLQALFPAYISQGTRRALAELCMRAAPEADAQAEFASRCLAYVRGFGTRYPEVVTALFRGEELGGTRKQFIMHERAVAAYPDGDPNRDVRREELWNGAGEHSLSVGMLAEILARRMGLGDDAVRRVALAGGLHDWWKKHQIVHMWDAEDALAKAGMPVTRDNQADPAVIAGIRAAFDAARDEDIRGLRDMGIPEDVIALAGHTTSHDVLNVNTDEQLIVFYLDHVMAGVRPTDMLPRIRNAVNGNASYRAYELSYAYELGGKDGHQILLEDGKAHDIQQRVADRIGYTGDLDRLHEHLTEMFVEAVNAQS